MTVPELFDSHFHCDPAIPPKQYRDEALATANDPDFHLPAAVETLSMMAMGADYASSTEAAAFSEAADNIWFGAGVHPEDAENYSGKRNNFNVFRNNPKLKCIGEIGLDYFCSGVTPEKQRRVMDDFLTLALEWELPAVIHLRGQENSGKVYADGLAALRDFSAAGGRFYVHCYTGGTADAERLLALGAMLGVTGIVTFKKADNVREVLKIIPDDRLLIETDSPYLAPCPRRGRRNTPGLLPLTALRVAEERGTDFVSLAALTAGNARRFFALDSGG